MQVILLETIQNLGELGEEVKVKGGYARNFLVPHGKAVFATDDAKEKVEAARRELAAKEAERIDGARMRADAATKSISIGRLVVDETGKLFGSVTNGDIAEEMRDESVEIARAEVHLPDGALKQVGNYDVEVILHPEVRFNVNVNIFEEGKAPNYAETSTQDADADDGSHEAADSDGDVVEETVVEEVVEVVEEVPTDS